MCFSASEHLNYIKSCPYISQALVNSIFRLYGNETNISPTLVFGEVYRSIIALRAYKYLANPPPKKNAFLLYAKDQAELHSYLAPANTDNIASFADLAGIKETDVEGYRNSFASNILRFPYSFSLAVIARNNQKAYPQEYFLGNPELSQLIKPTPDGKHDIPSDEWRKVVPGTTKLSSIDPFLAANRTPGSRTAWVIDPTREPDIWKAFRARGLMKGNLLRLNGWVFISGKTAIQTQEPIFLDCNGGIVLQEGNFVIKHAITPTAGGSPEKPLLQLVAMNGNIRIEANQPLDIHAALTSKGEVSFTGSQRPKIFGSVAMLDYNAEDHVNGAQIRYASNLAARPLRSEETGSEQGLLMFSVSPFPMEVP
ncbi:MAG: hypothetical protein ACOYOS_25120 [Syntrophales bacterium]